MKKEKITGKIVDLKVLKRLLGFIGPYKGPFYLLVLLTITTAVLGPVRPWIIQIIIDDHIAIGDYQGLVDMTLLLLGLFFPAGSGKILSRISESSCIGTY